MQPIMKRLSVLCAASLLLACATVDKTTLPVTSAEESYLLGRSHHMSQHPAQALAYYEAALRTAPHHVNARNGLAALYAEQGQLDKAIPIWEALTTAAHGREGAFLFANLGHAYLLRRDYAHAELALERACLDDPLNARAWEHLGTALAALGAPTRAQSMLRQAADLRGHDLKSDYAVTGGAPVPAVEQALRSAPAASDQWARTEVSQSTAGTFVLRRIASVPVATLASAPAAATAAENFPGNVLLEISNGNGITGMARAVSREVGNGAAGVVRLTNQKGFKVQHTRVEYKLAFRDQAERLAGRYVGARVVRVGEAGRADIRLVLGRDMIKPARPVLANAVNTDANKS